MKAGDLEPDWIVDITDEAADFTTAESWRFEAWRETRNGSVAVFADTDPVVTPGAVNTAVTLAHEWVAGETDDAGTLHAEVIAVWPGGREQTLTSSITGTAKLVLEPDPTPPA